MINVRLFNELRGNGHDQLATALENLLTEYPVSEHAEITARLEVYDAAMDSLLELAAYRLIHKEGHRVLGLHPALPDPGIKTRPDFLVSLNGGAEAFVEVTNGSPATQEIKNQERVVTDAMNGLGPFLSKGDWHFQLNIQAEPDVALPYEEIAKEIKGRVSSLPVKSLKEPLVINFPIAKIQLIESKAPEMGAAGIPVISFWGWLADEIRELPLVMRIRRILSGKSKRYGIMAKPFILIVGLDGYMEAGEDEILSALLGRQEVVLVRHPGEKYESFSRRDSSGIFGDPSAPQNSQVSGILFVGNWRMDALAAHFRGLTWPYPRAWGLYVTNPYAAYPVPDAFPHLELITLGKVEDDGVSRQRRPGGEFLPFVFS